MVRPSKIQIEDCSAELPELQKCEWYKVKGPSRLQVMRVALSGPWVGEAVKNSLSHAGGEVCGLRCRCAVCSDVDRGGAAHTWRQERASARTGRTRGPCKHMVLTQWALCLSHPTIHVQGMDVNMKRNENILSF